MPTFSDVDAHLVVCDLKGSLTEAPVERRISGQFDTNIQAARNALLSGQRLDEERLNFFDDHREVKFVGMDQATPFRRSHPFMLVRAGYRDAEKDNKETQGYLFPTVAPSKPSAGEGQLDTQGPGHPSTPERQTRSRASPSTGDTIHDPITPNPPQGGSWSSGDQQASHPRRAGQGPPQMGHFPAHQTGPVAPKGKGRGKANPANISGGLASDSVARAETGQPEKGLALVLETKKGEGLKAWSSRGQDLMIDVFHNGVHAETRHCSSKMDFSQPLVFSGTRIRYLVEKAWTFQAAQGQILSDVGKVPRDIALDRWRAIGDSLAGEAESFGRRENGQVPPVADYLFALAAAPYPEKLADLQELGQARFGVIDVVLTLGNADRLPRSATYLQRAAKRPDPGYPHSTFLPSDNTGTERPVAKAMGKRNQAGSAGAGKAPQKQQDETQGPGEGQPAALGSHEATHGSLRATYDDATMTMEDLEREIQAEEDLAAEGEFESTLRYLRSAPPASDPSDLSGSAVQSVEPISPLERLAREPSTERGIDWAEVFGAGSIDIIEGQWGGISTPQGRTFTSTIAASSADSAVIAQNKKGTGKHGRQHSSPTSATASQGPKPKRRRGAAPISQRELRNLMDSPGSRFAAPSGPRTSRTSSGRGSPAVFGGPASMAIRAPQSQAVETSAAATTGSRPIASSYSFGDPEQSHGDTAETSQDLQSTELLDVGYGAPSHGQAGPYYGLSNPSDTGYDSSIYGQQVPSYPSHGSQVPSYAGDASSYSPTTSSLYGQQLASHQPHGGHATAYTGFNPSIAPAGSTLYGQPAPSYQPSHQPYTTQPHPPSGFDSLGVVGSRTLEGASQAETQHPPYPPPSYRQPHPGPSAVTAAPSQIDPALLDPALPQSSPPSANPPTHSPSQPTAPAPSTAGASNEPQAQPTTTTSTQNPSKRPRKQPGNPTHWTCPTLSRGSILSYPNAPSTPIDTEAPPKKRAPGRPAGSRNVKPPANVTGGAALERWRRQEQGRKLREKREGERREREGLLEMEREVRQVVGGKGGVFWQDRVVVGLRFVVGSDGLCGFGEE